MLDDPLCARFAPLRSLPMPRMVCFPSAVTAHAAIIESSAAGNSSSAPPVRPSLICSNAAVALGRSVTRSMMRGHRRHAIRSLQTLLASQSLSPIDTGLISTFTIWDHT